MSALTRYSSPFLYSAVIEKSTFPSIQQSNKRELQYFNNNLISVDSAISELAAVDRLRSAREDKSTYKFTLKTSKNKLFSLPYSRCLFLQQHRALPAAVCKLTELSVNEIPAVNTVYLIASYIICSIFVGEKK